MVCDGKAAARTPRHSHSGAAAFAITSLFVMPAT